MTPGDVALGTYLTLATLQDVERRRIPHWLTGLAFMAALVGAWFQWWAWEWEPALFALMAALISGVPGGDARGMVVSAGWLGWTGTLVALAGAFTLGWGLWYGAQRGWWRSPQDGPFFPLFAAPAYVMLTLRQGGGP